MPLLDEQVEYQPCRVEEGDDLSLLKEDEGESDSGRLCDVDSEVEAIGCGFFHYRMVVYVALVLHALGPDHDACSILGLGNAADAVEILAMNYILADYGEISPSESSFLTAAVFAGMLVGGLIGGVMADHYGRRPIVLLNLAINSISALLSALSPSIHWLILFRTLAGIGVGGIVACLFALCVEHLPAAARARFVTILCSFWMIGSIVTAAAAWVMLGKTIDSSHVRILPWCNWRYFAAFAGLPAFLCFGLAYLYVPESARFLASQKNYAAAEAVLVHIMALNGVRRAAPHLSPSFDNVSSAKKEKQVDLRAAMLSPSLRLVAVCLFVASFCLSFGSYGISTWITKLFVSIGLANPYANAFLYAGANLPGNLFSFYVVDSWGASTLLMASLVAAAICAMLFAVQLDDSAAAIVALACLFNALATAAWNAFGVVTTHAFPLSVRVTGMALVNSVGRVGAISAQFVNGYLIGPPPHLMALLLVTASVLLTGALAIRCMPRTTISTPLSPNKARSTSPSAASIQ
ncbi:Aste57867_8505 [Aphanomyces stellatus]|uniref:Aste57867_8505 protein n=1 Tax=Aphanomyces stellatus TaxID=120398 RepID=A0A485KKI1_9STRA|nr:hypothetical protein As57867_008473 [Aphanomyces stellatus]VFT85391.1 Aste57867_8505 [Aphanomyces stellatus]